MNAVVPFRQQQAAVPAYAVSDLERMAVAFAGSKLFGISTPDQALALCLVAQAEGRHPASAAQDYHIISGRPAKKADAMLRDFISAGGKVEWHALDNDKADATFSHPQGGTVRIDWTLARAQAAGLATPMWKKYPRQMLRSRVVSEGVRTVCPGATSGMYVPEEVQDFAPETQQVRDVTDEPDFTDTPQPPMPKSKARPEYERLCSELRALADKTEDDLTAWYQANADAIGAQPNDWRAQLRTEYGDTLKAIRARAADPHGLKVDLPTDEPKDWIGYVEQVLDIIAGAPDAEQVEQAQILNGPGLSGAALEIEGVPERVAEAVERRLAHLQAQED